MVKQNLSNQNSEEKKPDKASDSENERVYTCGFCGKEFSSKLGLKKHLPNCEASPDEQEPKDEPEDKGIRIFDDDEDEPEDDYECGYCGKKMPKPYKRCPECGEVLEWP